jgi:hypothetical protein
VSYLGMEQRDEILRQVENQQRQQQRHEEDDYSNYEEDHLKL